MTWHVNHLVKESIIRDSELGSVQYCHILPYMTASNTVHGFICASTEN